ncbi:MAG: YraN family protein [Betaproteobacteria bacterium]|nr:YraN family protein [Betaproteobacteria bacterium]
MRFIQGEAEIVPDLSFPMNKRQSGQAGEDAALAYLLTQGLTLVERNFSSRMGEIDLIMKDRDTLVFVEVRKRGRNDFGSAVASITHAKQQRLVKTAQLFLQKLSKIPPCRFDVVALDKDKMTWLKNMIDEI